MQMERLQFKEFSGDSAVIVAKPAKSFLPGGRFRGEVPPPPPAPTFTEEQLKAAERDGYKKGFLEGTEEGRKQKESEQADVERKLSEALEGITQAVSPLFTDYRQMALQIQKDVPSVALAIARKIAGQALSANAQAAVEDIATRCVESMISEPGLVVIVHESLAEALEQKLALLTQRLQAASDITVMRDPTIGLADCRIEWKNGAFARDTARMWQDVERAIETMTASVQHAAKTHLDSVQPALAGSAPTPTDTKE